jgi:hypothetical protein
MQPPCIVLMRTLCCSCSYQSSVHFYIRSCGVQFYIRSLVFMFISEVWCSCFISEVVYSQVLSGSSVTVVIDRSRSEGDEVVYIRIKC